MHTTARLLAPLLLTLGLLAGHTPTASAAEAAPAHTHEPAVAYPLTNLDGTPATVVVVDAARLTWQAKRAARQWDALIPGLTITLGACRPELPCIRVRVGTYDAAAMLAASGGHVPSWSGLLTFPEPGVREVLLNRATTPTGGLRAYVAAHELGHALGLNHNDQPAGLMCAAPARCSRDTTAATPLDVEVAALAAYYAQAAA